MLFTPDAQNSEYLIVLNDNDCIYIKLSTIKYQIKSSNGNFNDIDELDEIFDTTDLRMDQNMFIIDYQTNIIKIRSINHKFIWYVFSFSMEMSGEKNKTENMDIVQNLRNEITTLKTILKSLLPEICANGSINDLSYLLSNINVNDLAQHMIISLFDHAIPIISWDKNKDYILSRIEIFKLLRKKFNDQYELWSVYNKNKSFMCLFKNSIENFVDIVDEKQLSLRFEMFKTLREYFQDEYDVFLLNRMLS